jgi:hypothetical protein
MVRGRQTSGEKHAVIVMAASITATQGDYRETCIDRTARIV